MKKGSVNQMISIKEVTSKRDLKKFIQYPIDLYKDNAYFVPSLSVDEMMNLDPKKNPAYEYCDVKMFLAYQEGKIVGRICGIINHAHNQKTTGTRVRFNRFDVIDDIEVSKTLMGAVMDWAKQQGMNEVIGPLGFCDLDKQGMLIKGFDQMNMFITYYNHEYYVRHMEQMGFTKDADWIECKVFIPSDAIGRLERISELTIKRYGYQLIKPKTRKEAIPHARVALQLYNIAFAPLYGVVPLTDRQIELFIKQFVLLVNLDYVLFVLNNQNEMIGFGLSFPSLAMAVRKSKGKLFPLGWLRLMRAIKHHTTVEMGLIAVKPEYQGRGVNALLLAEGVKAAIKHGVKVAETGPELEDNNKVLSQWKDFEVEQHKTRRSWTKSF
jgi:GNAT superfamily N-acetyltransferase